MDLETKTLLTSLFWRAIPAAAAFLAGFGVLLVSAGGAVPGMLLGMLCILAGSIVLAFPVANLIATAWDRLLWSRSYYDKPQPMYGIPQSRRAKGQLEEALFEYEKIAAVHPDEIRPHLEMIDLAIHDLRDAARAQAIYERGLLCLKKPEDRELLSKTYAEVRTRLDPKKSPPHITLPKSPSDA